MTTRRWKKKGNVATLAWMAASSSSGTTTRYDSASAFSPGGPIVRKHTTTELVGGHLHRRGGVGVGVEGSYDADARRFSRSRRRTTTPSTAAAAARSSSSSVATLFSSRDDQTPTTPDFFKGAPSTPGFKPGQLDKLSSWAVSTSSNRPVVAEYDPDGFWLWTQWDGTIRQMTYQNVILSVMWSVVVDLYCYQHYSLYIIAAAAMNGGDVGSLIENVSWASFEIPHSKDPIIDTLTALNSLWEYQLSLAVFTLSFFVNHAYSNWRDVYLCTRAIQGRLNDLCMLVTMAAKRSAHYGDVDGVTGYDTKIDVDKDSNVVTESDTHRDAKKLVQDVTRLLRMSHAFFWAATPTCSDGLEDVLLADDTKLPDNFDTSQLGPMLLSKNGLEMLVEYGQLTENEMNALVATGLPPSQYPYVLMEWAGLRCIDGMEHGELRGGPGMEENLLSTFARLRAEYFSIGDFAAGRMPMAYVQFMEVLVDTLIFLAPLALYVKMGTFNIVSTALLTLFFKGLLELSKSFLDPFGREGYRAHNIRVDVLVSEMNFGASSRWVAAGDALPSDLLERDDTPQSTKASTGQPAKFNYGDSLPVASNQDILSNGGASASVATGIQNSTPVINNVSGTKESNNGGSSSDAHGSDASALHDKHGADPPGVNND